MTNKPLLRSLKSLDDTPENQKTNKSSIDTFSEPTFFAPKKLTAAEVSKLGYRDGLIHLVQSKAIYPMMAQDLEQTGSVILAIDLDKEGRLIGSKLKSSSDFELLNEAALDAAKSFEVYKPLPTSLHPYATFLIPIHFF